MDELSGGRLDALLHEERKFEPSDQFRERANWNDLAIYEEASRDLEGFWAEQAESIDWFRKWDRVLDWKVPDARWFVGASSMSVTTAWTGI